MKSLGVCAAVAWLLMLTFPRMSVAAVEITVFINGQQCWQANDTLSIGTTACNGVTIQGLSGGNARVFAGTAAGTPDDGNIDHLTFDDARITAAQANTEYTITFQGKFISGPTTPPNYWYKLTGFQNNAFQAAAGAAALNSWVQVKGSIEHITGSGTWIPITGSMLQQTINNLNFKKVFTGVNTLSQEFSAVTGNRTLKGEVKFKVTNTSHELRLLNGTGIKIFNSSAPGPPGGEKGKECPDCTICQEADDKRTVKGEIPSFITPWWEDTRPFKWFFGHD